MENAPFIGIVGALALLGLAILLLLAFGIRNLLYGKVRLVAMGTIVIPVLIFGLLRLLNYPNDYAAILTALIMFGLGMLALLLTGIRGLFS